MKKYIVICTIQSQNIDDNKPVEVQWYGGKNLALAIAAMTQAAARVEEEDTSGLPATMRYKVLSVRLDINESEENNS